MARLNNQSKCIILKVLEYFDREKEACLPLYPISASLQRAADATGYSVSLISKLRKNSKFFMLPDADVINEQQKGKRRVKITDLDDFDVTVIRNTIHNMYRQKEIPTLDKLLIKLRHSIHFKGGRTSLWKILKKIGFKYKTCDSRKFLMERSDVVSLRQDYLSKICEIRKKSPERNIIYLDETWVNQNHCVSKMWIDADDKGGLKVPTGKGGRLIVLHAGSRNGFVKNAAIVFNSKSGMDVDYHHEMNSKLFKTWFLEQLLPNIEQNSVIIMDNASYHSVKLDKSPTTANKKQDILNWLNSHGTNDCSMKMLKAQLLEKVKQLNIPVKYEIDEIAKANGHQIVRLPPYHCEFNPIELIWGQVKSYVARNNTTFKMKDIKDLTLKALDHISKENWFAAEGHVKTIEQDYKIKDGLIEEAIEKIVIVVNDESTESDLTSSTESN